jgi:hypothetical protein
MKKKEREYGLGFVQKEKNEREKRETESRSREQQRVRHRKGDREGLEGPPRDGEADRPESPSESLGGPFRRCLGHQVPQRARARPQEDQEHQTNLAFSLCLSREGSRRHRRQSPAANP